MSEYTTADFDNADFAIPKTGSGIVITRLPTIYRCPDDCREEIHAADVLDDGPLIGWHCQCCDQIIRHQDYQ